jgi:hypothetical protein
VKKLLVVIACLVSVVGVASAGPKMEVGEDGWLKLSFLGQVHASYSDEMNPETDIFLRRGRLILAGQIMDGVTFFAETDNDKAGKSGAGDVSTDIQDAYVDFQIMDSAHWAKAGLILLPFSFETRSSAASLLGLDYNSEVIKLSNTFVWRDYGAELHGHFFAKKVAYTVGVFDGYDSETGSKNPDAETRFTGHAMVNLVGEAETGWFYTQNSLGSAGSYLSIGAGFDQQDKATLIEAVEASEVDGTDASGASIVDSEAWVVDFKAGTDLGSVSVNVNGAWYDWDSAVFVGSTAFVEAGVLAGKTMLTGKLSLQDPTSGEETKDYTAGLHYFMKNHNVRGGLEYRWGDNAETVLAGVQFLL